MDPKCWSLAGAGSSRKTQYAALQEVGLEAVGNGGRA